MLFGSAAVTAAPVRKRRNARRSADSIRTRSFQEQAERQHHDHEQTAPQKRGVNLAARDQIIGERWQQKEQPDEVRSERVVRHVRHVDARDGRRQQRDRREQHQTLVGIPLAALEVARCHEDREHQHCAGGEGQPGSEAATDDRNYCREDRQDNRNRGASKPEPPVNVQTVRGHEPRLREKEQHPGRRCGPADMQHWRELLGICTRQVVGGSEPDKDGDDHCERHADEEGSLGELAPAGRCHTCHRLRSHRVPPSLPDYTLRSIDETLPGNRCRVHHDAAGLPVRGRAGHPPGDRQQLSGHRCRDRRADRSGFIRSRGR